MQQPTPHRARRVFTAGLAALALVLAGCGGDDDSTEASTTSDAPDVSSEDSANAPNGGGTNDSEPSEKDESADDAPDPEPSDDDDEAVPEKEVKAGTVKPGSPQTAKGKGDALVTFKQSDDFAVVASFECAKCKDAIEIQQLGGGAPIDTGKGSLKGSYILDLIGSADEPQALIIRANGSWKIELSSWNDLSVSSGTQKGKGSKVLYLGDTASQVEVTYTPPKGGGEIAVKVISAVQKDGDEPKVTTVTGAKKFTKKKKIGLPGVIAVSGTGSWTIKPIS